MSLHVELVSPERMLWSGEAEQVIVRTIEGGDIAFLTGHSPFLGALETWTVSIYLADGAVERAAVHGGFVSVMDNRVIILSDLAEMESQIDVERARRAREQAEAKAIKGDDADAVAALARANARLGTASALAG